MVEISVTPATRYDDVAHALSGGGDGRGCQCQWWMLTSRQFDESTRDERAAMLRDELGADVPPGLVAEVDGETAGWVRVGPRTRQPRLARTRLYGRSSTEPWDDPDVWAVSCFSVRREFRGRGVTATLLAEAVAFATAQGARVIEGYPIDTSVATTSPNDLYHGALSTFLAAGFRETARPRPDRPIVALDVR